MTEKYNSLFDSVVNYVRGSPLAAWLFLLSIVMLAVGINGFIEDTNSSYAGVQQLEKAFNITAASWKPTYLLMSLFFQVLSVVGFFFYLSDRQKYWVWLWVSFGSQVIDFFADVWYRSNGQVFQSIGVLVVSAILTFVFFTVGSEVALTLGLGLTSKLFVEGMTQLAIIFKNMMTGIGKFFERISTPKSGSSEHTTTFYAPTKQPFQSNTPPHQYSGTPRMYRPETSAKEEIEMIVSGGDKPSGNNFRKHNGKK